MLLIRKKILDIAKFKLFKSATVLLLSVVLVTTAVPPLYTYANDYKLDGLRNPDGSLVYGINYTPAYIYGWLPSVLSGENFVPDKIKEELINIRSMGFNSIRLLGTLYAELYTETDSTFANIILSYEQRYRSIFDICREIGLTATVCMLPVLENGGDYKIKGGKVEKTLEMFVKRLGVDYKDVIILWEIMNEPDVNTWGLSYEDEIKAFANNETWNNITKPYLESAATYIDEFYDINPEYDIPYSIGCMNSARCDSWDAKNMDVLNIHTYKRTSAESESFMNQAYDLDMATLGRIRPVVLSEVMMAGMLQPADDIIKYCQRNNVAFYVWGYSAISFEQGFQGIVDLTGKTRISTLPIGMITDADKIFPMTTSSYDLTAGGLNEFHTVDELMSLAINSGSADIWKNAAEHLYNWARYTVPYYTESFETVYNSAFGSELSKAKYVADLACAMAIPYVRTYETYTNDNTLGGNEIAEYYESFTKYNTNDNINTFRSRFSFGEGKDGSKAILMQGYNSLTVGRSTADTSKTYSFRVDVRPLIDSSATVGIMCHKDDLGTNPGLYFQVTGDVSDAVRASDSMSIKHDAYNVLIYGVSDYGEKTTIKEISLSKSDFDSDGYFKLKIEYSGLGTTVSPLSFSVYSKDHKIYSGTYTGLNTSDTVSDCFPSLNTPDAMGAYYDNIVLEDESNKSIILSDAFESGKTDYDYLVYDTDLNKKGVYPSNNYVILNELKRFRSVINIEEEVNNSVPQITKLILEQNILNIGWNYTGSGEYGFEIQRSLDNGNTWKTYWRVSPKCLNATIPVYTAKSNTLYRIGVVTADNSVVKYSKPKSHGFSSDLIPEVYYTFDKESELGVDSVGIYNLMSSNAASDVVFIDKNGVLGSAVHFGTLDSYDLYLYSYDMLEAKTDFTVSAYAKLDNGITEGNHTIFSNGWQNSGGFSFGYSSDEWMYICADVIGGDWLAFNLKSTTKDDTFSAYDWHNYTLTLENGKILKVYIDGSLAFSQAFNENVNTVNPNSYFNIGSTYNGGYHLAGAVDEVKVFGKALTEAEILEVITQTTLFKNNYVAHYTFNDFAKIGHDDVGNYSMTSDIPCIVSYDDSGVLGGAVHFLADTENVNTPLLANSEDVIDGKSDFTVSLFAKLDEGVTLTGDLGIIFSNGGWGNKGISFGFNTSDWFIIIVDGNNDVGFNFKEKIPDFNVYEWHNYTLTVSEGKNLNVYIDGRNVFSTVYINTINSSDTETPSVIGSTYNGGYALSGSVDEAKIYHTALSAEQIKEIIAIQEPFKGPEYELLAHYSFDNKVNLGADNCKNFMMEAGKSVSFIDEGITGGAACLSSVSDGNIPFIYNGNMLDGEKDITISAFARLNNDCNLNDGLAIIFSNGGWDKNGISFGFATDDSFVIIAGNNEDQNFCITEKIEGFNAFIWHNYTITLIDGKKLKVYIDGIEVFSVIYKNYVNASDLTTPTVIGSAFDGAYPFYGFVDEIKIYRISISETEINKICRLHSPLENMPIAEYKFDIPEFIGKDSSGNYMLSNIGNVTTSVDAKFGKSAFFPGENWQSALHYNGSDFTDVLNEITFTCYAKFIVEPTGNMCLLSTGWDPNGGISFGISSGGRLFFDATVEGTAVWKSVKTDVKINEWHYYSLSVCNDGKIINIALDGKTILTENLSVPVSFENPNFNLTLGQSAWLGGYSFIGMIDEVRIYDYGMTDIQLAVDYNVTNFVEKADINADGNIDIIDLVCAKKYLAGTCKYDCIANMDVNSDYLINAADLLLIRKMLLGINV